MNLYLITRVGFTAYVAAATLAEAIDKVAAHLGVDAYTSGLLGSKITAPFIS